MIWIIIAAAAIAAVLLLWTGGGETVVHATRRFLAFTPATKRALRTVMQLLVALATGMPALLLWAHGTPIEAQVTIFAGWVAIVSKIVNELEDAGLIPAWLKDDPTT